MTVAGRRDLGQALQGRWAGFASRVMADVLDVGVVWLLSLAALLLAGMGRYMLVGPPFRLPVLPPSLSVALITLVTFGYLAAGWAVTGRTLGKQLLGLRVVNRSGRRLHTWPAVLRAVLCVLFPAGLLWVLISRRNLAVHDLLARCAVIYDWSYRAPRT